MSQVTEEVLDLVAEAARTSPHAAKAYKLMQCDPQRDMSLAQRQQLIAGRMRDAA